MRQFTSEEIDFIIENENTMTLQTLAKKFKCSWKDVYEIYSQQIYTQAYRDRYDRIREEKRSKRAKPKNRLKKILERIGNLYEKRGENKDKARGN